MEEIEPSNVRLFSIGSCEEEDVGFEEVYFLVVAPGGESVDEDLCDAREGLLFVKPCREGFHRESPGFVGGAVCALRDVWYVFALRAAGAAIMFPVFPSFHPFPDAADFGDVFHLYITQ